MYSLKYCSPSATALGAENDRKPSQRDYHLFLYSFLHCIPIYEIVKINIWSGAKSLTRHNILVCVIILNLCNCDKTIQHLTKLQLNSIQFNLSKVGVTMYLVRNTHPFLLVEIIAFITSYIIAFTIVHIKVYIIAYTNIQIHFQNPKLGYGYNIIFCMSESTYWGLIKSSNKCMLYA